MVVAAGMAQQRVAQQTVHQGVDVGLPLAQGGGVGFGFQDVAAFPAHVEVAIAGPFNLAGVPAFDFKNEQAKVGAEDDEVGVEVLDLGFVPDDKVSGEGLLQDLEEELFSLACFGRAGFGNHLRHVTGLPLDKGKGKAGQLGLRCPVWG